MVNSEEQNKPSFWKIIDLSSLDILLLVKNNIDVEFMEIDMISERGSDFAS